VSPFPQITKNIEVKNREEILNSRRVNETYKELLNELSDSGKMILRPSGTEPVIRISVESDDIEKCRLCVDKIEKAILEESVCQEK
jgi:phosphoglucosamine mutase